MEVIRRRLEEAAAILNIDEATAGTAWKQIVDRLWEQRSGGLSHREMISLLEVALPGDGKQGLTAFRRVGLLSAATPIRIADVTIGDHVFAENF